MSYLSDVGKVKSEAERRIVQTCGLIKDPALVLKLYTMTRESISFPEHHGVLNARRLVAREVIKGNVDPLSGLGFVIFSEGTANIARWDKEESSVLVNQAYEFDIEHGQAINWQQLDIAKDGAYCSFESQLVAHEARAWNKFLRSSKTRRKSEKAKQTYIDDTLEGLIK
ncbi:hypothetical protein GOV04_04875 [Candidatus Woesearchaeota archaeon]|nr:hypothetical protein [Candidatus Woesearchaeota archaeon]